MFIRSRRRCIAGTHCADRIVGGRRHLRYHVTQEVRIIKIGAMRPGVDSGPTKYYHLVMRGSLGNEEVDVVLRALSDPTRRAILVRLAQGDAGVLEIGAPFLMTQPAITKHLKVLENAGLISRYRDARRRLCRLEPTRLRAVAMWVGSYQTQLVERFERLDDYLDDLQSTREITK